MSAIRLSQFPSQAVPSEDDIFYLGDAQLTNYKIKLLNIGNNFPLAKIKQLTSVGNLFNIDHVGRGDTVNFQNAPLYPMRSENEDFNAELNDYIFMVDTTNGQVDVELPLASEIPFKTYVFRKIDDSDNSLIINAKTNNTINGDPSFTIEVEDPNSLLSIEIMSDGISNWQILRGYTSIPV